MSRTSPAQVLADSAGLSIKQAARKAGIGEAYLRRLASRGDAPAHLAARLGYVLECSPQIFLWGYAHFSGANDGRRNGQRTGTDSKRVGSSPTTTGSEGAVCGHSAPQQASRRRPCPLRLLEGEQR